MRTKIHVLSSGYKSANSQSLLNPLLINRKWLLDSGLKLEFFSEISESIYDCDCLVIDSKFFKPLCADQAEVAIDAIGGLANNIAAVFWFHTGDSAGSLGSYAASVLPLVKKFYKSQVYSDKSLYQKPLYGNRLYTDFYNRQFEIEDDYLPESDPMVSDADLPKIQVSWNIGFARCFNFYGEYLAALYQRTHLKPILTIKPRFHDVAAKRSREIYVRMGLNFPRKTIGYQRLKLAEAMGKQPRVSRAKYYREMKESKVVVSPFGWGEINNRDFEAFIYGCLLVKPSMNHLETFPHFFQDGETFLSYNWDLSDMTEKIDDAVANYPQYLEIAKNAQDLYASSVFSRSGRERFVQHFGGLVNC